MATESAFKVLAVLFGILAVSNFSKPLELSSQAGFVLFGERLSGASNAIAGPIFGALLAAYAYGIWTKRSWALPLGGAYAAYVIINLVLFQMRMPASASPGVAFGIVYAVVAIGVSAGAAMFLARHRDELS